MLNETGNAEFDAAVLQFLNDSGLEVTETESPIDNRRGWNQPVTTKNKHGHENYWQLGKYKENLFFLCDSIESDEEEDVLWGVWNSMPVSWLSTH